MEQEMKKNRMLDDNPRQVTEKPLDSLFLKKKYQTWPSTDDWIH